MSILSAIKDKIVNVQQDISNSIHLPFLSSKQETPKSRIENTTFNANAGAELLALYQRNWIELHQLSDENARRAQELDAIVANIFLKFEKENAAVNEFFSEALILSKVVEQLRGVNELVNGLEEKFKELDAVMVTLEDVCDVMHQDKNTVEHEYQLTKYQQRKNIELEQAKVELARQHAGKVRVYEEHLNNSLRERQKVFEEAFHEQMQQYKRVGKLEDEPQIVHPSTDADHTVDLAEIAVEDDPSQLENFLNSPELNTEVTKEPPAASDEQESNSSAVNNVADAELCGNQVVVEVADANDNRNILAAEIDDTCANTPIICSADNT